MLAWLLAQKAWIVPIPGTTKTAHLDENLGAVDLEMDAQEMKALADGFARIRIQGTNTGVRQMAALDLGDRPGTTSAGGHGMSPLPPPKR